VAAIVGSAFGPESVERLGLTKRRVPTALGEVELYQRDVVGRNAYVLFRHGIPHRLLPHQVPYRAHAAALHAVGCEALLVTSSVGVLDAAVPLFQPMPVGDLLMPENRLPDGSACTMFAEPRADQGHLVVREGLFSRRLGQQVASLGESAGIDLGPEVVFGYVGGPRTKTKAENRFWARVGAQVNSMSLAPEVVLANELEMPTTAWVVGHKHSHPDVPNPAGPGVERSLSLARAAISRLVGLFLDEAQPVSFENELYRFREDL
jgi:5'-methylthioadenosine phosphorylase